MKKFELTSESIVNNFGKKLFRIKALVEFGNVKEGELGGFVEKEENLSHEGDAWVSGNARVYENARVSGNAWVSGNARVSGDAWVSGYARVYENARVSGNARVYENARVSGYAWVSENARVSGDAWVSGNARVYENARVSGYAWVSENARVSGDAWVSGDARVSGYAWVCGNAEVCGNADCATVKGFGTEFRTTTFFKCKDRIVRVKCGCFYGDLEEFRVQVKNTRKGKIAEEYLMIADLMEKHFKEV